LCSGYNFDAICCLDVEQFERTKQKHSTNNKKKESLTNFKHNPITRALHGFMFGEYLCEN
jgi:hypothetical protein